MNGRRGATARSRALAIAAILILTAPTSARAQGTVGPEVDGTRLALGTDSLRIILIRQGQEYRLGSLWDELSLVTEAGEQYLRRVYRTTNELFGPHLDTLMATWPGLEGRSQATYSSLIPSRAARVGNSVVGWRGLAGDSLPIRNLSDAPPWDEALFDLMVRASDLRPDLEISTLAYSVAQDTVHRLNAVVKGREVLRIGTREYSVWRVDMDSSGLSSTMWIDEADRSLRKQVIRLGPGVEMTMVSFTGGSDASAGGSLTPPSPESAMLLAAVDEVIELEVNRAAAAICLLHDGSIVREWKSTAPELAQVITAPVPVVLEADCPPTYARMFSTVDSLGRPMDPPRPPGYVDPYAIEVSEFIGFLPDSARVTVRTEHGMSGVAKSCLVRRLESDFTASCRHLGYWVH